jgi:flagellar basal-body rod modification protein FlgD
MDINEIAGVNMSALNPSPVGGNQDMGRETFLKLLTTQMQNQDPMSPMDNQQFIQQLTQFSSLEQLMGLQNSMDSVYMAMASMNNSSMANLLGTEVVGVGDKQHYSGEGETTFNWNSSEAATELSISVMDENGKNVATFQVPGGCEAGEGSFTWNGKKGVVGGGRLPEGTYTFKVNGTDVKGELVSIEEWVRGIVSEMDYSGEVPQPSIQGVPIDLSSIVRLSLPNGGKE